MGFQLMSSSNQEINNLLFWFTKLTFRIFGKFLLFEFIVFQIRTPDVSVPEVSGLKGTEVKMPDINLTADVAAPEISARIFQINYFFIFLIIILSCRK